MVRGIKLLLDEGQGRSYTPTLESKRLIQKPDKDTVEVVGDYLNNLVSHATELINRRFGYTLDCMDLKYVLTVPAVWSDGAKNSTLRAGTTAASSTTLVSEPEAAATICLNSLEHSIKVSRPAGVIQKAIGSRDKEKRRVCSLRCWRRNCCMLCHGHKAAIIRC